MKKTIYLQLIGTIDDLILNTLKENLENYFKEFLVSINISDKSLCLHEFSRNRGGMKYNRSEILKKLAFYHEKSDFLTILGLIDEDIKSLKRKYIFGIAKTRNQLSLFESNYSLKPGLALISFYRLRENFYSKPKNDSLFKKRILKIAIHEIGHSLGLTRCNNKCIMECKRTISEVDKKPMEFCEACQKYLKMLFSNLL